MSGCNLRKHTEHQFCCGGCKRAFSSMVVFDWHRRGGVCADPGPAVREGRRLFRARVIPGVDGSVELWGEPGREEYAETRRIWRDRATQNRPGAPNPHSPTPDPSPAVTGPQGNGGPS